MSSSLHKSRRWYDSRENIALFVTTLAQCPDALQTLVAEAMSRLGQKQFKANDLLASVKSLGVEKTLGLYQAKKKQRHYDQNATFHHAMNCLYVLHPTNQDLMATQVLELLNMLHQYLQQCRLAARSSSADEMAMLTNTFVESGSPAAKRLLQQFKSQLMLYIEQHAHTALTDNSEGMRLVERPSTTRPM